MLQVHQVPEQVVDLGRGSDRDEHRRGLLRLLPPVPAASVGLRFGQAQPRRHALDILPDNPLLAQLLLSGLRQGQHSELQEFDRLRKTEEDEVLLSGAAPVSGSGQHQILRARLSDLLLPDSNRPPLSGRPRLLAHLRRYGQELLQQVRWGFGHTVLAGPDAVRLVLRAGVAHKHFCFVGPLTYRIHPLFRACRFVAYASDSVSCFFCFLCY